MQHSRGEPLFIAEWIKVVMIHFAVDARVLQSQVPFTLDLHEGSAFVTLVAFTMRHMRPAFGGRLTSWMLRPIATHDFLNVRTYVRSGADAGIHFLAEWVSNRLAVALGPPTFSLPYRYGRIRYQNDWTAGELRGQVEDVATGAALAYDICLDHHAALRECDPGSLDEWLMERYSAFNSAFQRKRFFRVWHEPWQQCKADVEIADAALLESNWDWFRNVRVVGANYSPGVPDVWLGRPWPVQKARNDVQPFLVNEGGIGREINPVKELC